MLLVFKIDQIYAPQQVGLSFTENSLIQLFTWEQLADGCFEKGRLN